MAKKHVASTQVKHALVTGGAGFIGSHVVEALFQEGWRVTVIDDLSSGKRENLHPAATLLQWRLSDPRVAKWVLKQKPSIICHFAAQISVPKSIKDPIADAETNVYATLKLMDAAQKAGVSTFLFASTAGVLSAKGIPLPTNEGAACDPISPYAIAKRTIEYYGDFYHREYGLPFIALRFANVYGPRQNSKGEAGVISIFVTKMLANEPIVVNGTGKQTRDFIFVEDIVQAVLAALHTKRLTGLYHIGTGKQTSIQSLFQSLAGIIGYSKKAGKGPEDRNAVYKSALDAKKFMAATGWKPTIPLRAGLKKTILAFQTDSPNAVCLHPFRKQS